MKKKKKKKREREKQVTEKILIKIYENIRSKSIFTNKDRGKFQWQPFEYESDRLFYFRI